MSEKTEKPIRPEPGQKLKVKGFNLIELLVATGILIIIATMGTNTFILILKGAAKTRVLNLVKYEGNYALGVMSRMIRNAKTVAVDACGEDIDGGDFIEITNSDGQWTRFHFFGSGSDTFIASESAGRSGAAARLTSDRVRLASDASNALSCTLPANELDPYVVSINFTLVQAGITAPRPEEEALIDFGTTVSVRNM